MSMVQVRECETAEDVRRLAIAQARKRRAMFGRRELAPEPPKPGVAPGWIRHTSLEELLRNRPFSRDGSLPQAVTLREIKGAISSVFGVPLVDLHSTRRAQKYAVSRQIGYVLAKILTTASYPAVGRSFGGRDHTTVLHGVRKFEWLKLRLERELQTIDPVEKWAQRAFELYSEACENATQ